MGDTDQVELRLTADSEVLRLTRPALLELLASGKVGMEARYRDRWTHPRWKPVYDNRKFRSVAPAGTPAGRTLAAREAEARCEREELSRNRFGKRVEDSLGVRPWGWLGENLAVSRLVRYPNVENERPALAVTLQWRARAIAIEYARGGRLRSETIGVRAADPPLRWPETLRALLLALPPPAFDTLDGDVWVHRFGDRELELTQLLADPESDGPEAARDLVRAYENCVMVSGIVAGSWSPSP